jgi:ribosomal protein S18 acetylase RimI-like enzyme
MITIRKAVAADAVQLLEFMKRIGGETDNLTFGGEGLPFSVEDEAVYISSMENSRDNLMLLAKDGEVIVGNASLSRMPRRMSHRGDFSVAVAKDYWNKGIGRALLEKVIAFAKENDFAVIDLQVRSDNQGAIHLYEKYGFQKIGSHPAFFKINGENVSFDYMYLSVK